MRDRSLAATMMARRDVLTRKKAHVQRTNIRKLGMTRSQTPFERPNDALSGTGIIVKTRLKRR